MRVNILFDKVSLDKRLHIGWGVSFLVDGKVLFDTGEDGQWLIDNMKNLKIDPKKIEAVVISHDHWDHTGGLWQILSINKGLKVYGCLGFSSGFKTRVRDLGGELIEKSEFRQIAEDIYISGQIQVAYGGSLIAEQAIILETDKGVSVMTGCSHPGIIKILEQVKKRFPKQDLYSVFGGFHLITKDKREIGLIAEKFKQLGVRRCGPTHCSGDLAEQIFENEYGEDFIPITVGQTIEV